MSSAGALGVIKQAFFKKIIIIFELFYILVLEWTQKQLMVHETLISFFILYFL